MYVLGESLPGSAEYVHIRKRHRNIRLNPLEYGQAEQAQSSPSEKYRVENFIPVIDQFIASLDQRLHAYKLMSGRFGCFGRLTKLSSEELSRAAKKLLDVYPNDMETSFPEELIQFTAFANIYADEEPNGISTKLFLYKLIHDKHVLDIFPNVEVALRMYLVLMVSNCNAERSFSKLNLIENRLRTNMTQERLVNLTVMSIETDILCSLDFDDVIREFSIRKSRKVPGLD